MSSDENTPDFDNMSPEELMAWMETLAERQGATEGFTTEKRVDIAEVDPDSAKDTGPGYIPYGMSEEEWAKRQEKEEAEKQARLAERARQQELEQAPPPVAGETVDLPDFGDDDEAIEPAAALDDFALPALDELGISADTSGVTDVQPAAEAEGGVEGLGWLEDLAAEQTSDFPEMDLSGLGDELANMDLSGLDADMGDAADPMAWLEDMAGSQEVPSPAEDSPAPPEMSGGGDDDVDPIEWLESLAAQSDDPPGVDEFMTDASLEIPVPDLMDETQAPGYEDFEFENASPSDSVDLPDIDSLDVVDSTDPDDPSAWLDSLAASQGASPGDDPFAQLPTEVSDDTNDEAILSKLNKGISDPSDMENWMSALLEKGANRDDVESDYIEEEEDAAIEAQIPDWLLDQVGTPPEFLNDEADAAQAAAPVADDDVELPAGLEDFDAPIDEANIPDWLQDDVVEDVDLGGDEENIFAAADQATLDDLTDDSGTIDTSDPWVEAFEEERTQEGVPDWYMEKLAETTSDGQPVLEPADLDPEAELPHGQPEPVPDWLTADSAPTPAFLMDDDDAVEPAIPGDTSWLEGLTDETSEISDEDIPDWLKEQVTGDSEPVEPVANAGPSGQSWLEDADIDKVETIPDWLLDTISEGEEPEAIASANVIEAPTSQPVPQAAPIPATPAPAPAADVSDALQSARTKFQNDDLDGALADYESVVRANAGLDEVINDLSTAIKKPPHKNAAPIYRVLGDSLMRKGRLQDALDTYRKALNLL